jgi:glycerophosphoryl diester phosphodiesterase
MNAAAQLIAHRGLPKRFPENTLVGLEAAVAAGAQWLEIDLQLTAERVPILYHDDTADRVSGFPVSVLETRLSELQRFGAFCPQQFGARFRGIPISTLGQLVTRMNGWPGVRVFVEIKADSVQHFGAEVVHDRILADLSALLDRGSVAAIISKDLAILKSFRTSGWPIGWVLPAWDDSKERLAQEIQPDYLFVKQTRVPLDDKLVWQGRWDWAVYSVDEIEKAVFWRDRGWPFVETNVVDELIEHPRWTLADGAPLKSM